MSFEQRYYERAVSSHSDQYKRERPDEKAPRGTDRIPQIQHIVVLMMENHSYDNYFGALAGRGDGFTLDAAGAPTATNANRNAQGVAVPLRHRPTTAQEDGSPTQVWAASHIQFDDGVCDGFVRSIEKTLPGKNAVVPMDYWTEADIGFYYGLAKTFPLATRWFCSCLGPTFPNRRFLVAATANGLIDDVEFGLDDYPAAGTIFELLSAHGISWANFHDKPFWPAVWRSLLGRHVHALARRFGLLLTGVVPGLTQYAIGEFQYSADMYPHDVLQTFRHALPITEFFDRASKGQLPAFSLVDPNYGSYSEEDPQDVQIGEGFAAAVIDAVMHGPSWKDTVLIWLYDEHGGYYDHVPPPEAPAPDDVPASDLAKRHPLLFRLPFLRKQRGELELIDDGPTTYDRLGFRVPAVVVSPYARPDFVTDTVYDHTSILRLVEDKWNLPSLTHRDAAANSPIDALDLEGPPAFLQPPVLPTPAKPWTVPPVRRFRLHRRS